MGYIFSFYKTLIIKVKQIIFLKQTENWCLQRIRIIVEHK